jgi:hypothetical protein
MDGQGDSYTPPHPPSFACGGYNCMHVFLRTKFNDCFICQVAVKVAAEPSCVQVWSHDTFSIHISLGYDFGKNVMM